MTTTDSCRTYVARYADDARRNRPDWADFLREARADTADIADEVAESWNLVGAYVDHIWFDLLAAVETWLDAEPWSAPDPDTIRVYAGQWIAYDFTMRDYLPFDNETDAVRWATSEGADK